MAYGADEEPPVRAVQPVRFALLLFFASLPASAAPAWEPVDVDFEVVLEAGATRPITIAGEPQRDFVIRDEAQWCDLWRQVHPLSPCDTSGIDFQREVVIGVAGEGAPCGGPRIDAIERSPGRQLTAFVDDIVPVGCPCLATLAIIYPVEAVVVPRPVRGVEFLHERVEEHCGPAVPPRPR